MRIAAIHAFTGTPGEIQLRDLSVLGSEPVILQNQMLTPEIAVAVALTLLLDPACKISDEALRTVTETLVPVIISEAQQRTVLCYIRSLRRQFVDPEDNGAQGLFIAHRALIATGIGAGVALVLLGVWYAADLLLLVFAGVLVSILLRGFSRLFARATGVGHGLSLALVSLTRLALLAGVVRLIGGSIGSQLNKLQQQLPQAVESLNRFVARYEWAHSAIESLPSVNEWLAGRRSTIVWRVTGLASTTLGMVVNAVLVVIIGLYLASQPGLYAGGLKRLLPWRARNRAGEVLGVIDKALWRWLIGRFGLMLVNVGLTAAGLWLLGMPLAPTLGLLAGVLNFVPNFGPLIAAIPAVLIAFLQGPQQALYVALLYVVLRAMDGYVLTPLVDRRSVELPPVLWPPPPPR